MSSVIPSLPSDFILSDLPNVYPRHCSRGYRAEIIFIVLIRTQLDGFNGIAYPWYKASLNGLNVHEYDIYGHEPVPYWSPDESLEEIRKVYVRLGLASLESRLVRTILAQEINTVLKEIFDETSLADRQFLLPEIVLQLWHEENSMAFFFRSKKVDMIKPAKELLLRLWQPPKSPKTEEELAKLLSQIKATLIGTQDLTTDPGLILELFDSMKKEDFLYTLSRSIHLLPFEARKDSQAIFSHLFRFQYDSQAEAPVLSYVCNERPEVLINLCCGYSHKESSAPCGTVLREILKHEDVTAVILYAEVQGDDAAVPYANINTRVSKPGIGIFWLFFNWIDQSSTFEIIADALNTFRDILTKHKALVAKFLADNFEVFFESFNTVLIGSESYLTRRQSIKLLGEILLDRANYSVMTEYVTRGDHLKLCMNLLRDDRKMIQYEGFHVFKVFVANPHKSEAVLKILTQNRERLLRFLPSFLEDRTEDDQFMDEKAFLIRQIEQLPSAGT